VVRTFGVPDGSPEEEVGVMYEIVPLRKARMMIRLGSEPDSPATQSDVEDNYIPSGTTSEVSSLETIEPGDDLLFSVAASEMDERWFIQIPISLDSPLVSSGHDPDAGGLPRLSVSYSIWELPEKYRPVVKKK
jgi:hypothetical protein